MDATGFVKILETVGIPVATAIALGFGLAKLLSFVLKDQRKDIASGFKTVAAESTTNRETLIRNEQLIVALVDRVRVLERNTLLAYTNIIVALDAEQPEWNLTRREKIAELQEQIKDIGRNGEPSGH
jgi:hypothetical protein